MKIIFLDIDGVLVTRSYLEKLTASGKSIVDGGMHVFDPKCVANLKRILDATGAKIVLSSSWKFLGPRFHKMWKKRKLLGEVIGFTPNRTNRGTEIEDWLSIEIPRPESFVIIDDDINDMLVGQLPNIVKTEFSTGLTDEKTEDAIHILNGG